MKAKKPTSKKKSKKAAPTHKSVRAYAVLGHPDLKPMVLGDKGNGAVAVFARRDDAIDFTTFRDGSRIKSWKVVPCTITYKLPKV